MQYGALFWVLLVSILDLSPCNGSIPLSFLVAAGFQGERPSSLFPPRFLHSCLPEY